MRTVGLSQALVLAIILCATGGAAARADELVVMPYSCTMIAGRPSLRPSNQQGYRILGPRETRPFRACSPANPGFCRQWTVYRFQFDCNGVAVPWIVAVAAIEEARGDVWLQDGRLHLRMPPDWNMGPDDPCAEAVSGTNPWRQRRLSRYCAERAATMPPPVVAFPATFAPTLGIDAIFVPAPAAQGQLEPLNQTAGSPAKGAPPPPAKLTEPKVATAEERAPPAARKTEESNAGALALKPADPHPQVAPSEPPPPPARKPADAVSSPATPRVSGTTGSGAPPVTPRIINRDWASASQGEAPSAPQEPYAAPPAGKQVAGQTQTAALVPPAKHTNAMSPPPSATSAKADPDIVTGSTGGPPPSVPASGDGGAFGLPVALISVGLGLLVLSLGVAVVMARRREHAEVVAMTSRDIAAVPLRRPADERAIALRPGNSQSALKALPPHPLQASIVGSGRMPETREEALQVLGMGFASDTGLPAIKKVVDGLRMSWHPDFAVDAADRRAREMRLKQINAAWDILAGNRAAS
ncbi:MAG TPA: hypothetical protein VNK52_00885 [Hyphomicrobiaceae bacterium]|nr:hypothetical protein [Hyphomicrobiaceae bacterium]